MVPQELDPLLYTCLQDFLYVSAGLIEAQGMLKNQQTGIGNS
jgi:hypothetical protein